MKTKQDALEGLLSNGMVLVALDARIKEVVVPKSLKTEPQLRLNISWNFGLPMDMNSSGVFAQLTFAGVPFDCFLPWDAIFVMVSHTTGESFVFNESIPTDVFSSQSETKTEETHKIEVVSSNPNPEPSTKPKAKLSVVK